MMFCLETPYLHWHSFATSVSIWDSQVSVDIFFGVSDMLNTCVRNAYCLRQFKISMLAAIFDTWLNC